MCGAVRYRIERAPIFVHCCHCTECQRQNGSAFAVNALVETDCVTILAGGTETAHMPAASGRGQTVHRCGRCGTLLWSHYAGAGAAIAFVRVGTLDDPTALPPDIHIFTSTKAPWVILPTGVPAVPNYYSRNDYWPQSSKERYDAARTGGDGTGTHRR